MENLTPKEVKERVISAIQSFIGRDMNLLAANSSEMSLTQNLSIYLQREFPEWDVDCEYNRRGQDQDLKQQNNRNVYPDIIIHKRGTQENNLVAIEAKKSTATYDACRKDRVRLQYFMEDQDYTYQDAFFIVFHVKPNERSNAELGVTLEDIKNSPRYFYA